MSSTNPPLQSQLSFSPALFQKIDPALYLFRHLTAPKSPRRPCSRLPNESRQPVINTSPLSHANGSAVVRSGDTAVVCGVRAEVLPLAHHGDSKIVLKHNSELNSSTSSDPLAVDIEIIKSNSLLVPNLELGTGCNPKYTPGPPSDYAQAVAERWRSWLVDILALVPSSTLEIMGPDLEEGPKAYWTLYIDVMCISLDGGLIETGWAAIVAALQATWLPFAKWDKETGEVVYEASRRRPLELRQLGFCSVFAVFRSKEEAESVQEGQEDTKMEGTDGGDDNDDDDRVTERKWILADPDDFEESVCEERIVVLRRANGDIAKLEMGGGVGGEEIMSECLELSKGRVEVWKEVLGGKKI